MADYLKQTISRMPLTLHFPSMVHVFKRITATYHSWTSAVVVTISFRHGVIGQGMRIGSIEILVKCYGFLLSVEIATGKFGVIYLWWVTIQVCWLSLNWMRRLSTTGDKRRRFWLCWEFLMEGDYYVCDNLSFIYHLMIYYYVGNSSVLKISSFKHECASTAQSWLIPDHSRGTMPGKKRCEDIHNVLHPQYGPPSALDVLNHQIHIVVAAFRQGQYRN